MASHVFLRDAEHFPKGLLHRLRALGAGPYRYLAVTIVGQRDRRFHGRMRQMRDVVICFHNFSAFGKYSIDIADVPRDLAWLAGRLLQLLLVLVRVVGGVGAVVPCYVQLLTPLKRSPTVVGNHCNAAQRLKVMRRRKRFNENRLRDALYLQWSLVVVSLDLATQHRRMLDRGIDHAIYMSVHAETRFAGAKVGQVVAGGSFADISPRALGLEF